MVKSGDLGRRESGRSEDFITGREHKKIEMKNKVPLGGGWVEGGVKTLLLGGSTKKSAAGRGVSGRRSEDFITGREHKKIEIKNKVPLGGGWVEGGVKTLLLGGSTKKKCRWEGVERKEEWRLYYWEEAQKNKNKCCWEGGEWKEEWRLYYWEEAEKRISAAGRGGWAEGGVKTLLLGGSTKKKKVPLGRGWVEGGMKTLLPGGSTIFFLPVRGVCVCVGESVKILTPAGGPTAEIIKSEVWGREANTENKIKTSKQSKHKVKFVSHPLPAKKISVTHRQKQVKPDAPSTAWK